MPKRYIDADKLDARISHKQPPPDMRAKEKEGFKAALLSVRSMIHSADSADVQEVVRCKDCVHFKEYEVVEDFDGRCTARGGETDNDGFCNYGEKGNTL